MLFSKSVGFSFKAGRPGELRSKPSPGVSPIVVGSCDGYTEDLSGLLPGEPGKEPQLDHLRRARVLCLKLVECVADGDQIQLRSLDLRGHMGQLDPLMPASRFWAGFPPSSVYQNPPHGLSGGREEVVSAVPVLSFLHIHQADVRLMDQCRGLEGLARLLLGHLLGGQLPQFVVDQGQELLRSPRVALARWRTRYG
jgi:hypothetical protein